MSARTGQICLHLTAFAIFAWKKGRVEALVAPLTVVDGENDETKLPRHGPQTLRSMGLSAVSPLEVTTSHRLPSISTPATTQPHTKAGDPSQSGRTENNSGLSSEPSRAIPQKGKKKRHRKTI